jgi:Protein of unknown function (DUF3829)
MTPYRNVAVACFALAFPFAAHAGNSAPDVSDKLQPYIKCINRLSERAYQSKDRYIGWAGKASAITAKPKNIIGLYEIYETTDCANGVEVANGEQPRHPDLEAAGTGYVKSVQELEAVLKSANEYYDQGNYKDDKMAKGRDLHPKLMAAFAGFGRADNALRGIVEQLNDAKHLADLAEIEKTVGRNAHYLVEALMIKAKHVVKAEGGDEKKFDLTKVTEMIGAYEASIKELEDYTAKNRGEKVGSMLVSSSKTFLISAKELMRRVRDKVPYSEGDRMIMNQPNAGWMVQGSPARLSRDYNQLIETYNRH